MQADFVPAVAAEQLPDGHLKVLGFDVVEGNVDGADRAAKHCAAKGRHAVEVLPVVFDTHRVLSDEVFFENGDHALDRFGIAPTSRGADAGNAAVCGETHDIAVAEEEVFESVDFHDRSPKVRKLWVCPCVGMRILRDKIAMSN